jgi:hypothetical protein
MPGRELPQFSLFREVGTSDVRVLPACDASAGAVDGCDAGATLHVVAQLFKINHPPSC